MTIRNRFNTKIKPIVSFLLIAALGLSLVAPAVQAAEPTPYKPTPGNNLLRGASFESDIFNNWGVWQTGENKNQYTLVRSYEAAFGQGSYAAGIEVAGAANSRFSAGLVGSNSNVFYAEPGKTYWLRYYAKATAPAKVSVYLESASTYAPRTPLFEHAITTDYKEYNQIFTPDITAGEGELLVFAFGDIADKSTLYLDGFSLVELNTKLSTVELRGSIGDTKKALQFTSLNYMNESDIEVELPYYNEQTGVAETKRFPVDSLSGNTAYISFYKQTFAGVGRVYIKGQMVGAFSYNVVPKILDFYPSLVQADQDVSLHVSGFNPMSDASFVVVKAMDKQGKVWDRWLKPERFDSQLNYVTVKLPTGAVSGSMFMQASFQNAAGKTVENRTTAVAYKVKPVIYKLSWSQRGYDQVGDKLLIYGKGIASRPTVSYVNEQGKVIGTAPAKLVDIFEKDELIEVPALKNANKASIVVTVDGVTSDQSQPLAYLAKPRLTAIMTKNRRIAPETKESLAAAQPGEMITLRSEGVSNDPAMAIAVEFQGYGQRLTVPVEASAIDKNGTGLTIAVPTSAQTGFIAIVANGQKSNYLPMEIIPKVINVYPNPVLPGQDMTITAQGVGTNEKLAKVIFNLTTSEKVEVTPQNITIGADGLAIITLPTPMAISNKYSSINLRYDRWQDNSQSVLAVQPTITEAAIDLDTGILTIRGYGFSISPKENQITYKYADQAHTVITPRVQVMGVYPTEDGQEIRIKILDTYHYGFVSVKVGEQSSNEANFGPVSIRKIVRRVEFVKEVGQVTGVIYLYGYNFGTEGDVKVGSVWANTIYRNEFAIVATVDPTMIKANPIIVTKK